MADQVKQKDNKGIGNGNGYSTLKRKGRKCNGFTRKCASLFKEQRARIYILRRCATMLLCSYIQGDD